MSGCSVLPMGVFKGQKKQSIGFHDNWLITQKTVFKGLLKITRSIKCIGLI